MRKKLSKSEKRVAKFYWLLPSINKRLKKDAKSLKLSESRIVEMALEGFLE